MSDLIDRQAAIDALDIGEELLKRVLDDTDVVGFEREKYAWGLGLIESYISDMKELPSAEPKKGKWIPVSEKLPKYSDSVLVSACGHEIDIGSYYCDKWHINGCGPVEDGIVIAWMPLPEPYKEKERKIKNGDADGNAPTLQPLLKSAV